MHCFLFLFLKASVFFGVEGGFIYIWKLLEQRDSLNPKMKKNCAGMDAILLLAKMLLDENAILYTSLEGFRTAAPRD